MYDPDLLMDKKEENKIIKYLQSFIEMIYGLNETNSNLKTNWDQLEKLRLQSKKLIADNQELKEYCTTLSYKEKKDYLTIIMNNNSIINNNQKIIERLEPVYNELRNEQTSIVKRGKSLAERAQNWLESRVR